MNKKNLLLISLLSINSILFSSEVIESESKENKELGSLVGLIDFKEYVFVETLFKCQQEGIAYENSQDINSKVLEKLNKQSFKEKILKIFSDDFTPEEISDLVKFYTSKSGTKFREKMLVVREVIYKIIQETMMEMGIPLELNDEEEEQEEEVEV